MDANLPNAILAYRRYLVVAVHLVMWSVAWIGAFQLRFDFDVPDQYREPVWWAWMGLLLAMRTGSYAYFGLFRGMWKYAGQRDLESIVKATLLSSAVFALALFAGQTGFPRSVLLLEFMLAMAIAGGLRFAVRAFAQVANRIEQQGTTPSSRRRVLIAGAGDAGEALVREMLRNMQPRYEPVAFVDDNVHKLGMFIHNIPVKGTIHTAEAIIREHEISEVVIAIPTATGADMRRIVEAVSVEGVAVRTVPDMEHLIDGQVTINQIREVAIEDLLGRDPVNLDVHQLSDMIRNEVVMVTGAGGSIGSELCRQVGTYRPRTLMLVERAENALYHIHREIHARFPDMQVVPCIADITDASRLDDLLEAHRPGLVLHAAAHKHVPMMEWNPGEAIKNNVGGTLTLAEAALRHDVSRFVMISTDKAVNPTSVMGCTKRVAELVVQSMAGRGATVFVTVRFGNVLGSNGSVIPLFQEQIRKGGPVTVTHPDMQRYFMTIPEAAQLVLQAGADGNSGEIYVLDMGQPVKITQLAKDLIRLSGLRPGADIEICYTGMRPGEKLFEELSTNAEEARKTRHPKIYIGTGEPTPWVSLHPQVDDLLDGAPEKGHVLAALKGLVPEFDPPGAGNVIPMAKKEKQPREHQP